MLAQVEQQGLPEQRGHQEQPVEAVLKDYPE